MYYGYGLEGMIAGLIGQIAMTVLIPSLITIIANWRIYKKMGYPGWYGIIPLYNSYILYKDLYGDGWLFWLTLVPVYNIYVIFRANTDWAHNFGKSTAFGVGLCVLGPIFNLILAFGGAEYESQHYSMGSFPSARESTSEMPRQPAKRPQTKQLPASAAASRNQRTTIPPFQERRCCICNRSIDDGYSVLFTNDYGAEARIDENCGRALDVLANGENPQSVQRAMDFMQGRLSTVDPKVAAYLKKYIKAGEDFLFQ